MDHTNEWVEFPNGHFNDPVVILGVLGYNGGDPSTVEITEVHPNGFKARIREWDYLDGPHTTESISYMVVERGCHNPREVGGYCAGTAENRNTDFAKITFAQKMEDPVVFATMASQSNNRPFVPVIKAVKKKSFKLKIQAEESQRNAANGMSESVNYT